MATAKAELLTPEEAALILRVTRRTIYNRLRTGTLKGKKFGGTWLIPRKVLR